MHNSSHQFIETLFNVRLKKSDFSPTSGLNSKVSEQRLEEFQQVRNSIRNKTYYRGSSCDLSTTIPREAVKISRSFTLPGISSQSHLIDSLPNNLSVPRLNSLIKSPSTLLMKSDSRSADFLTPETNYSSSTAILPMIQPYSPTSLSDLPTTQPVFVASPKTPLILSCLNSCDRKCSPVTEYCSCGTAEEKRKQFKSTGSYASEFSSSLTIGDGWFEYLLLILPITQDIIKMLTASYKS